MVDSLAIKAAKRSRDLERLRMFQAGKVVSDEFKASLPRTSSDPSSLQDRLRSGNPATRAEAQQEVAVVNAVQQQQFVEATQKQETKEPQPVLTQTPQVSVGEPMVKGVAESSQEVRGTFTAAPKPRSFTESLLQSSRKLEFKSQTTPVGKPLERQAFSLASFGVGAVAGFTAPFRHPVKTAKGILNIALDPKGSLKQLGRDLGTTPAFTSGTLAGGVAVGTAIGKIASKSPVKIRAETIKLPLVKKGIKSTVKIRTVGLEAGTRSVPIASKVSGNRINLGLPKTKTRIKLQELKSAVPAPVTATGGKAIRNVLELTKAEQKRVGSFIEAGRILQKERGLRAKQVEFPVEGIKDVKLFTREIQRFSKKEKGTIFGTATTEQLPFRFQKAKLGDVDIFIPKTSTRTIPKVKKLAERLRLGGEDVVVSKKDPLNLELSTTGKKVVEIKTKDVSLGEQVVEGAFGFEFGFGRSKTTPFGKTRATKAGQQFVKKGSAVSFFRPETTELSTPTAFRGPGVFPKGKRFKDLPDFVAQGFGLIELRKRLGRSSRRTSRAKTNLDDFVGSFKPKQQTVLVKAVKESTKGGVKIRIKGTKPFKPPSPKPSGSVVSLRGFRSPRIRISPTPVSPPLRKSVSSTSVKSIQSIISPSSKKSPVSPRSPVSSVSISSITSPKSTFSSSITSVASRRPFVPSTPPPPIKLPKFKSFKQKKKKDKSLLKRRLRFQPSLVAVEGMIRGKTPSRLSGLEIRKIPV